MREIIVAISILIAAAVQPLRAQQASAATPARAPFAAGPGPVYSDFTYGGVRLGGERGHGENLSFTRENFLGGFRRVGPRESDFRSAAWVENKSCVFAVFALDQNSTHEHVSCH